MTVDIKYFFRVTLSVFRGVGRMGKECALLIARFAIDVESAGEAISLARFDASAAIWAHHGMFCAGPDFDTTFGLMHTIEKAAQIATYALAANGGRRPVQAITDDNLRAIGKEFGVTLNEDILNYQCDDELYM